MAVVLSPVLNGCSVSSPASSASLFFVNESFIHSFFLNYWADLWVKSSATETDLNPPEVRMGSPELTSTLDSWSMLDPNHMRVWICTNPRKRRATHCLCVLPRVPDQTAFQSRSGNSTEEAENHSHLLQPGGQTHMPGGERVQEEDMFRSRDDDYMLVSWYIPIPCIQPLKHKINLTS